MEYVHFLFKWFVSLENHLSGMFRQSRNLDLEWFTQNVDKSTNKCKLAFFLLDRTFVPTLRGTVNSHRYTRFLRNTR